jgi:hypothetical protein
MKKQFVLMTTAAGLILAGCFVPSVNPLYTEKDLVFDPTLLGTWGKPDEQDRSIFTRDGNKAYMWQVCEKDGTNMFQAHLVQLREQRFLDAVLVRTSAKWEGLGRPAVVVRPAHIFFKIQLANSTLRLKALDYEWMDKLLKENPKVLAHERIKEPDNSEEGRVLITASTAALQRFFRKHAQDPKAFTDGDTLPRLKDDAGNPATP